MDEQTQSFLELSARDDLVPLVADKRAAWLWSADGARILWANAAGAAFFSVQHIADLGRLTALERSPARPHIARIAEAGPADRFSIDRLRFYRGLRVMLLTCQCRRIELADGTSAALIVCGDKGLAITKDPVSAFAEMLVSDTATVFVTSAGTVGARHGDLSGTPEDMDLPDGQSALFGAIGLDGAFHDGIVLQASEQQKLIVLENAELAGNDADEDGPDDTASAPEGGSMSDAGTDPGDASSGGSGEESLTFTADAPLDDTQEDTVPDLAATAGTAALAAAGIAALTGSPDDETGEQELADDAVVDPDRTDDAEQVAKAATAADPAAEESDNRESEPAPGFDATQPDDVAADGQNGTGPITSGENTDTEADALQMDAPEPETGLTEPDLTQEPAWSADQDGQEDSFVFQPRRRPVRFAWKMDIDQRFTFLSDEFSEVLGPGATGIVGLTWEEVSSTYGLDPRGQIARALDRRDTWSGKTVDWPVSGAALRVPVDLAALPAFDRNRKFEGYRGFGVCRTADAVQDADAPLLSPVPADGEPDTDLQPAETDETTQAERSDGISRETDSLQDETPEMLAPESPEPETLETESAPLADDSPQEHVSGDTSETGKDAGADAADAADAAADGNHAEDVAGIESGQAVPSEDDREQPEPDRPQEAAAANSLADLKPAQPDSLTGKTFLGASAAALVGSLARFTGKSAPSEPEPAPTARSGSLDVPDSPIAPDSQDTDEVDDLPGAALDSKLAALQSGQSTAFKETGAGTDEIAGTTLQDEAIAAADETLAETGLPTAEDRSDTTDVPPEPLDGAEKREDGEALEQASPDTETPTGISGPAALKPDEIESAVKSLAKSYKTAEKAPRDLFEKLPEVETAAEPEIVEAGAAGSPEAEDRQDASRETAPAPEDAKFDSVDAKTHAIEQTDADADSTAAAEDAPEDDTELPDQPSGDASGEKAVEESGEQPLGASADEREFFEETAAFETEERAAEAATGDEAAPEPQRTGQVIPLATARPRVVPVDTSGLSRPERQAFRKIAEALGARLEGDLEDFDAPDREAEPEDELPPEVPEAGPIDPSLLDRLPIGIAIVNDREVLYANKALIAMLGYKSIAKLSQAGGLEALFIDDAEELPDARGMDGEVDEAMKLRLSDGGVLNVDAHMHSVPWNGGHGLMISITERKLAAGQTAAAQSTPASPNFFAELRTELDSARNQIAEMDTILETATDGVLVLDQHGSILKVNGSAEALFSASRSDMIGAPFTEFLAPESHRSAADYLDGLSRNGVASILNDGREVLGKMPTGGLIPLFMTMGRISGTQDDAKYCAVLRDITQWKTAEEELTQAKRQAENASSQKSDFLAKISHEIRTPLNAIIGFSEVMMEERFGAIGNDRYKDYLKDIRTSGSHIMSLINDLLDLSKIEAGKLDLQFSAVSTNDIINECVALMQPQANRERVIIRASLPESVPNVVADPRSLRQIVLNLLSNAIKYNRSGGQVILSTALESNGEVALRVRDTGTGMTAKQLAAALEPFRQLHTSSRGGGTGLGLPLTKALVEANRASFHIDSTPDQGTLVEIVFPTQRVLAE